MKIMKGKNFIGKYKVELVGRLQDKISESIYIDNKQLRNIQNKNNKKEVKCKYRKRSEYVGLSKSVQT